MIKILKDLQNKGCLLAKTRWSCKWN